jgi:ribonuclease HI
MTQHIYFDGGSKPNPGNMEACVVLCENGRNTPFVNKKLGHGTNNVAEWTALLWAMSLAQYHGWQGVVIKGDSKLVINQAQGIWRIKQLEFVPFREEFVRLQRNVRAKLVHTPREYNMAGIMLEHGHC